MRRRVGILVLASLVAGCGGGPGVGSEAVVDPKPVVYTLDDGKPRVADFALGYAQEEGRRDRSVPLRSGTVVKVVAIRGDNAQVVVRSGDYEGQLVWVRTKELKAR